MKKAHLIHFGSSAPPAMITAQGTILFYFLQNRIRSAHASLFASLSPEGASLCFLLSFLHAEQSTVAW